MRVRLSHIALDAGSGRVFEIGDVVGLEDLPSEVLHARLEAGTAQVVLAEGGPTPEVAAAIEGIQLAIAAFTAASAAALDVIERGPPGAARDFLNAVEGIGDDAMVGLNERMSVLEDKAQREDRDAIEQVAPTIEATSGAAAADGPAAASTPSNTQQTEADTGAQATTPAPRKSRARSEPTKPAA